jgi:prophage regulatory protein
MEERLLKLVDVSARVGLSRSAIYSLIAQGKFPTQVHIGPKAARWRKSEIDAWIAGIVDKDRTEEQRGVAASL